MTSGKAVRTISKRLFILLCDHIGITLLESEKEILGKCTDETGRKINPFRFIREMEKAGLPLTRHTLEVIEMLIKVEYMRRGNY